MKDVIDRYSRTDFGYGVADCCQFVGECVEAMRGYNPTDWFQYADEDGAMEHIADYGSLEELVNSKYGKVSGRPCDGDIALFEQVDGSQILGVVDGDEVVLKSMHGIVRWPLNGAKRAWST